VFSAQYELISGHPQDKFHTVRRSKSCSTSQMHSWNQIRPYALQISNCTCIYSKLQDVYGSFIKKTKLWYISSFWMWWIRRSAVTESNGQLHGNAWTCKINSSLTELVKKMKIIWPHFELGHLLCLDIPATQLFSAGEGCSCRRTLSNHAHLYSGNSR
jgi:hypothetical protein